MCRNDDLVDSTHESVHAGVRDQLGIDTLLLQLLLSFVTLEVGSSLRHEHLELFALSVLLVVALDTCVSSCQEGDEEVGLRKCHDDVFVVDVLRSLSGNLIIYIFNVNQHLIELGKHDLLEGLLKLLGLLSFLDGFGVKRATAEGRLSHRLGQHMLRVSHSPPARHLFAHGALVLELRQVQLEESKVVIGLHG